MTAWARAHLEQARSDFAAAKALLALPGCSSQATMLLQMAWEKIAKAALDERQVTSYRHDVAIKFVDLLKRHTRIALAFPGKSGESRVHVLKQQVRMLESLTPAIARDRENTEYPWGRRSGEIKWPARDLTRAFVAPQQAGYNLWHDFEALAKNFDRLF